MNTRRDIDPVPDQPALIHDHVFDVDSDSQRHLRCRLQGVRLGQCALRIERPRDGGHRTRELDEDRVARDLQQAAPVLLDSRLDDVGP